MRGHNRLLCEASVSPSRTFSDRFDSPSGKPGPSVSVDGAESHSTLPRSLTPTESVASVDPVERGRFSMPSSNDLGIHPVRFIPARTRITEPSFEIPEHGLFHRVNPYRNQDFAMPPIAHFDGPPTLIVGSDGEPVSRMSTRHSTPEPGEHSDTPNSTMSSDNSNSQDNTRILSSISNHVLLSARTKLSEAIQKFREGLRTTPSTIELSDPPIPVTQDKGKMRQRSPFTDDGFNFHPVPIATLYEASDDTHRLLQENRQLNTAVISPVKQFRDISPYKNPYGFMKAPEGQNTSNPSPDRWIIAGPDEPHVKRIASTINRQNGVIDSIHKVYYTLFWFVLMIAACAVYDRIKSFILL